jgi:glycosyltransferase involved in cell wall biosynthesis
MQIAHLIETGGAGGAETVLLNLVTRMDRQRFQSTIVLMADGWLRERLEAEGLPPVILPSRRSYDLSFLRRLISLFRRRRIDLVHAHLPASNAYGAMAARCTGVPAVTTYHGMLNTTGSPRRSERLQLWLVRTLSATTVAVSDPLREQLVRKAGFRPDKVRTIYNGVDWTSFDRESSMAAKRAELGIDPHHQVIGMVGNLRRAKGYPHFVRAAARVAETVSRVTFLIIGEEEQSLRQELDAEIARRGLKSHVRFLGFRRDVPDLLRMLDVFVLSSLSEGMSIATVEAMGAGVPVVVTRSGGPEDLVQDGITGFLVPPRDAESMATKIKLLLGDATLAARMAAQGKRYARSHFGVQDMVRRYEALYEDCLCKADGTR